VTRLSPKQLTDLNEGHSLACRTELRDDLNCWLVVIPFKIDPETGLSTLRNVASDWHYCVRHFGIPSDFDHRKYDLHSEYETNFIRKVLRTIPEVEKLLSTVIENFDVLEETRKCNCPIG
jgi:hypothetical protein